MITTSSQSPTETREEVSPLILLPLDGSRIAEQALPVAGALARRRGAHVARKCGRQGRSRCIPAGAGGSDPKGGGMTATPLMPSHRLRPHRSEIELHIRAGTLGDLLAEAGRTLGEIQLAGADCAPGGPVRSIRVVSSDRSALLVDWLNQLIFLADIDRWVAMDFSIDLVNSTEVRARASGVALQRAPNRVKAATFRRVRVEDVPGGLEADLTLDV